MYSYKNSIPNNYQNMYRNNNNQVLYQDGERFFWAPFLVGGLAGTALGYGIANNQNNNNGGYYPQPVYPVPITQYYPYPCCGGYNNYNNYF